ncbi:MAG: hypothetical protein MUC97_16205 [Bernardetiaceae bacterium]|jgi:hypothetical protein|nr:hypothetical protein [Bernardetiaceae bacterium]
MGSQYFDEGGIRFLTVLDQAEKDLFQSLLQGDLADADTRSILAIVHKFFK